MTLDFAKAREAMVEQQVRPWDVLDTRVLNELLRMPREAYAPDAHRALAMSRQDADPASTLNASRRFLHWRRTQPALLRGAIAFVDAPEPVLAFVREFEGQRLLVAFNLSDAAVGWTPPDIGTPRVIDGHGLPTAQPDGGTLELPARGVFFAALD